VIGGSGGCGTRPTEPKNNTMANNFIMALVWGFFFGFPVRFNPVILPEPV
jgi:hypothetical protein